MSILRLTRRSFTAALGGTVAWLTMARAQDMMRHLDITSPDMVSAEMTRADIEAALASHQIDFTGKRLSGLDLSGLDLSGVVLRAARLNKTNLVGSNLDRAILNQAWLLDADLSRASLQRPAFLPHRCSGRSSMALTCPARASRRI